MGYSITIQTPKFGEFEMVSNWSHDTVATIVAWHDYLMAEVLGGGWRDEHEPAFGDGSLAALLRPGYNGVTLTLSHVIAEARRWDWIAQQTRALQDDPRAVEVFATRVERLAEVLRTAIGYGGAVHFG